MTILAVANQKGGVGKTTTAVNLAASLAAKHQRVLVIDVDPQANTTSGVGIKNQAENSNIYYSLLGQVDLESLIQPIESLSLDIIPSGLSLVGAEVELVGFPDRERRLMYGISTIISKNRYDFIIIDCPPSLGLLTLNALTTCHGVLIPLQCEYYALEGLAQLLKTIELVRQNLNKSLRIFGVLLTMVDTRSNLTHQVIEEVQKFFGERVFHTIIPRNIRLAEAPSFGKSVLQYDRTSRGAQAYLTLADEVIARSLGQTFIPPAPPEPPNVSQSPEAVQEPIEGAAEAATAL